MDKLIKAIGAGAAGGIFGFCYGVLVVPQNIVKSMVMTVAIPVITPVVSTVAFAGLAGLTTYLHFKNEERAAAKKARMGNEEADAVAKAEEAELRKSSEQDIRTEDKAAAGPKFEFGGVVDFDKIHRDIPKAPGGFEDGSPTIADVIKQQRRGWKFWQN